MQKASKFVYLKINIRKMLPPPVTAVSLMMMCLKKELFMNGFYKKRMLGSKYAFQGVAGVLLAVMAALAAKVLVFLPKIIESFQP